MEEEWTARGGGGERREGNMAGESAELREGTMAGDAARESSGLTRFSMM